MAPRTHALLPLACAALALAPAAAAQDRKPLTLDALYDPEKKADFAGTAPRDVAWIDDARYHWTRSDPTTRNAEHFVGDADTGATRPLFDATWLERELVRAGVSTGDAERAARRRTQAMDQAKTQMIVAAGGDLFRVRFAPPGVTRLTRGPGKDEEPAISPDGRRVAFVREHDLYAVEAATGRETRLTTDGSPDVLNGILDWVYQEEIYGRGQFKAHWWSPDSTTLAYLRLDEAGVPRYTLVDDVAEPAEVEATHYPRPGERNPRVRVGLVSAGGGATRWIDLAEYAAAEPLVVDVGWTPDGKLAFQVQDREQTWLDLRLAERGGVSRRVLRETTRAWVEPHEGAPHWLADGTFLWFSERDGWKHLYHLRRDGTVVGRVTSGEWEARTLHGVDEKARAVYFSGTERSPIGLDVYRVGLDGRGLTRLSTRPGTHAAAFAPSLARYVDTWSDVRTPPQARLHGADGSELKVIDAGTVPALGEYRYTSPELLQVKTRDGFVMEAMMIKPPGFDPARRYPVFQQVYAGPHAQRVRDAWGDVGHMFLQLVAQRGVLVWVCDNRTASGKGAVSAWSGYQRMMVTELADIEDGLAWLKAQPYVDGARIGIEGWSYGGMMSSYALTHSTSFAMGIVGAPVIDWRLYDSVYTERFMRTPKNNPAGYDETSPLRAAANLHGRLLLIHGAIDDNVHPQNSFRFAHALQEAGKPFRMMVYPRSRHAVSNRKLLRHLRGLQLDFIEETLLGQPPS
jgi:dipeptidyl-peptidase 4